MTGRNSSLKRGAPKVAAVDAVEFYFWAVVTIAAAEILFQITGVRKGYLKFFFLSPTLPERFSCGFRGGVKSHWHLPASRHHWGVDRL